MTDFQRHSFKKPGALKQEALHEAGNEGARADTGARADIDTDTDAGELLISSVRMDEPESRLPIHAYREQILYLLETHQVLILLGQTGSGKTTQVPQFLYGGGWTEPGALRIVCTQPRKLAAVSIATRVSQETRCRLGTLVGYSVRFDACYDPNVTRILYTTDGLLFREMQGDPLLSRYSVVMIDESHERSLYSDLLLGLLKKILQKRHDLRLVVCSATLDADRFYAFFSGTIEHAGFEEAFSLAPVGTEAACSTSMLECEGRSFPVSIYYANAEPRQHLASIVELVLAIHMRHEPGDILVFLSGRDEIEELLAWLTEHARHNACLTDSLFPLPLYSGLAAEQQRAALLPLSFSFPAARSGSRKVILATNVAEASVTIEGIVYVIDSGRVKHKVFDPALGMEKLTVTSVSKASAIQRAGRAGRSRPGTAFRLYTEDMYAAMPPYTIPELQRCSWVPIVLQLKTLGIDQLVHFQFPSRPPVSHIKHAMEVLCTLGAVDKASSSLTKPTGALMAELPVDPCLAKSLVAASLDHACAKDMIDIVAMMSVADEPVFFDEAAKMKFAVEEGDPLTLYNAMRSFSAQQGSAKFCQKAGLVLPTMQKAVQIKNQIVQIMKKFGLSVTSSQNEPEALKRSISLALATGHCLHLARWEPNEMIYRPFLRPELALCIHPSSILFRRSPSWILYDRVLETTKLFMKSVWIVEPEWMALAAPGLYDFGSRQPLGPG